MNFKNNPWIELAARLFVGGIFIYAGLPKLLEPCEFARSIYAYKLFPAISINLIAIVGPWFEVVTGVFLCIGLFRRGAAAVISGMLILFLLLLTITFIRGLNFDCGCFSGPNDICKLIADRVCLAIGVASDSFTGRLRSGCEIIRDLIFLIPALFVLLFQGRIYGVDRHLGRTP